MRPLSIVWQRLVNSSGQTCNRCGVTHEALQRAVAKLKVVLAPLDLEPALETREIPEESFRADPSASNRIWIAGRSLEEWLGARTGSSRCCTVCGDAECRTVEVGKTVFEAVPEDLILKAALIAAAQVLGPVSEAAASPGEQGCCQPACCTDAR
jgi:hypothetical protein